MDRLHFFQGNPPVLVHRIVQLMTAFRKTTEHMQSACRLPLFLQYRFLFTFCSKCQVRVKIGVFFFCYPSIISAKIQRVYKNIVHEVYCMHREVRKKITNLIITSEDIRRRLSQGHLLFYFLEQAKE